MSTTGSTPIQPTTLENDKVGSQSTLDYAPDMPQDAVPPSPSPSPPTISPESPRVPSSADLKLHDDVDTTPKPEECSGTIPDVPSSAPRHSAEPLEVPLSSATDSPDPEPFVMSVVHPDAGPSMPVAYFVTSRYLRMIADGYTTEEISAVAEREGHKRFPRPPVIEDERVEMTSVAIFSALFRPPMNDFFSAVGDAAQNPSTLPDDTKTFAEAIAARFGQGQGDLTARLLPTRSTFQLAPVQPVDASTSDYTASPCRLVYLSGLMIRKLWSSISDPMPLIPRRASPRLSAMLPSSAARTRFSAWRAAPRILVDCCAKFRAEEPSISLAWVQGGFQAVWETRRDVLDVVPPTPEAETEDDDEGAADSILRAHNLPRAAFALASTTQAPR
ncbi:hypothetical protein B0H14DRAFT_3891891, partial [Mycena olivaceomarginata]